uniref:DUF3752 domain-containing protein n=1 Tax=Amblyomma triste TaxID=251400 RepID=A0A023GH96_AMBTT
MVMSAYGPQLPDGFKTTLTSSGDAGSAGAIIGPVLPPGFQLPRQDDCGSDNAETPETKAKQDLYGPSLPPGFADPSPKPAIIGPVLPPGFSATKQCSEQDDHDDDSDSSDDVIGPMPSEAVDADYTDDGAARDIDRRATSMKRRLEGKDSEAEPRREEWMTHLPDNLGLRIGLGARTFRKNMEDPTADRSAWTDTPADKARKSEKKSKKVEDEVETSRHQKRHRQEKELEEQLAHYNKEKRSESLLDIHQKKKKEEKRMK